MKDAKHYQKTTRLIQHTYTAPAEFCSPQTPVYKASTVIFPNSDAVRSRQWLDKSSYTYGLHGTPTTYTLEERLCELEGGNYCLLTPSGLAALTVVSLALLATGDRVLLPDNAYGPNKDFASVELKRFGIECEFYDPLNLVDFEKKINSNVKVVWLEAAGSVTMEFPNLIKLAEICHSKNIISVLDNTWGAGIAFKPFDLRDDGGSLGVDITSHALTKYPSGGGDVLMGSIVTIDHALHMKMKLFHMRLGIGVAGNDSETILRSLPSVELRYRAHDIATRRIASWLQTQKAVKQVLHPAFQSCPGHENWLGLCKNDKENSSGAAAGIFSIVIDPKYSQEHIDKFCDALQIFKLGYSWGGPMSLVMFYDLKEMRSTRMNQIEDGLLIRFAIGLEDVDDLIGDIQQAMSAFN